MNFKLPLDTIRRAGYMHIAIYGVYNMKNTASFLKILADEP